MVLVVTKTMVVRILTHPITMRPRIRRRLVRELCCLETPASFEAEQIYNDGCTDPTASNHNQRQNTTMARVITRIMVAPIRWPRTMMKQQNLMMEVALILVNPSQPQLLTTRIPLTA